MQNESRADVTVDFDHHSPSVAVDPYSAWEALRGKCPVTWTPAHDGFWVLTDYASVSQAARDDDTFRSGPPGGVSIPSHGADAQVPLESDAPLTQMLRRVLQKRFSPAAATASEPAIRRIANGFMDQFIERGECDFMAELATPTPAEFILRMIGLGEGRASEFTPLVHAIVHGLISDPDGAMTAAVRIYGAIIELIEERRGDPSDDIVSELLRAELDGQPIDEDLIVNYTFLILMGGLDTTSVSLGNALVRLDRQPELRQQLLDRPELVPNAVEELLRIDTPVQALGRTVARDVELCGQHLKAGDRALLAWAAANRDPAQFPCPDVADFERMENRHLTFGVGLHRCLGSNYGRTMFRVMLETVLARTPDYELIGDPDLHRIEDASIVWGHYRLPARFTPGPRLAS